MNKLNSKLFVIPSIILFTSLLFLLSNSIASNNQFLYDPENKSSPASFDVKVISDRLSSSFPDSIQQWQSEIERAGQEHNIDPNLIAAVMLQESGGQPFVISSSGAVGLMQIMPKDGIASNFICSSGPCFKNRPSIQELLDPNFNIQFGAHMLSSLQKKTGSLRESLKAYGPMDVDFYYADLVLSIFESSIL